MNRRNFAKNALIGTIAIGAISSSYAFSEIITEKNFDFMSQDHPNIILINDFFAAYSNNDLEGIRKVVSEDIKWHIPGEHPLSGTKIGIEEVMTFFKNLNKGKFKASPIIMGANDNYVIDCHQNWSNLEDSENLNAMSCLLWRIANNKIIEVHNFPQNQIDVDAFFRKLYG
ncbi:nuclear transport factor 2 family protein [Croceitalea rosinachiae]|uniref:Nuclear transport factor 2 family protein n=1 Tax=Croceitalea rosinachiae TaxID=3075596 RepID=A0ABU3AC20_9FLAO|nr:nuclear transport factor 2 family protein [Croceitalea sp. F388]MDT0607731.1 nuclear transport factor 2 family protein [Croceitalea sp. F388]